MRIREVLSLAFLGVAALGLVASGGARDPSHTHVVIGGTGAERAEALAAHLAGEVGGRNDPPTFGVPTTSAPLRGAGPVRVVSVGSSDGGGPAVLSGWGAADATSPAPPWFPAQTATSEIPLDAAVDLAARRVPASDPPPRPV